MALRPLATSFPWPDALIPRSILIEKHWNKNYIRYSAEAHLYCSTKPSVFYHIVLNVDIGTFCSFNISIKCLICAVVVTASFLLSSEKKELNTAWIGHSFLNEYIYVCGNALKCTSTIPFFFFFFWDGLCDPIAFSLLGGGIPSQNIGYNVTRLCTSIMLSFYFVPLPLFPARHCF